MSYDEFILLPAIPRLPVDPVAVRRSRFSENIQRQIEKLAEDRPRSKRGRWFKDIEGGRVALSLRYARTELELVKGKHAVSCADRKEATAFLKAVLLDVEKGLFDNKLAQASALASARLRGSAKKP